MKNALKTIEAMTELVYAELKRVACDSNVTDAAFKELQQAAIDAINLKRKIELARIKLD